MSTDRVAYSDIPITTRNVLDEIYDEHEDVESWWNAPNNLLQHYTARGTTGPQIPRCYPIAAEELANALADGVFF